MIREFNRAEVVDTFVEVAREKSPIFRVDQSTSVELNLVLHSIIKETIERVIKKASPDLSLTVQVEPIHNEMYGHVNKFEPVFSSDPSDVHFYITREAVPESYRFNGERVLTRTHIGIDYYYPASWAMTPPRDEKAVIRRTMDEILFAWTIVSKTLLSAPIVRFDDEDEAAEAVFTLANTLLFNQVVVVGYYYKQDFISRLMNIERAIRGNQRIRGKALATIVWPKDNKVGSLDVPVVEVKNNKISQFIEGYVACYGQERRWEYRTILKSFTFYERLTEGFTKNDGYQFSEEDVNNYLENNVGQPSDDYSNYNMRRIQRLVINGDSRAARPPMIDMSFKGIGFTNVCPFTYGARGLTYIHFEKDIISHLEKVFKYANTEYATDIAKGIKLPEDDKTYDIDPRLIGLFQLDGTPDKEVYKNKGLYLAEEEATKQDLEASAQKAVQENIRSLEFDEGSVARGAVREYTAHWSDMPF